MDGLTKIQHDLPDWGMSPREIDGALADSGFVELSTRGFVGMGRVGEVIKNVGAIKIGRTKLLLSDEQMSRVFGYCEELIRKDCDIDESLAVDMDQRITLLQTMNNLAVSRAKAAEAMINSAKI